MLRIAALLVACVVACASNPGTPRFRAGQPRALPGVATPVAAEIVRIAMQPLPWWTTVETGREYVLQLGDPDVSLEGDPVGYVRSNDVAIDPDTAGDVRCAFQIVPMGDPRPCADSREAATEVAQPIVETALAELRSKAGEAGADGVREVRCFVRDTAREHVWCEGMAIVTRRVAAPQMPGSRFLLMADASVGMLGRQAVVGTTLGVRYRPIEAGFYFADLSRSTFAPQQGGIVGLGGTLLGRLALGRSRADAIAGVTAAAVAQNGATNPDFSGFFYGFAGVAYQTPWRISGMAQPFLQLRAGAARSTTIDEPTLPMIELHVGLTTPERR